MSRLSDPAHHFDTGLSGLSGNVRATRYRMLVLAADGADAVGAAGGLLFDKGSSGWIVDVRTEDATGATPFRILGVPVDVLEVQLLPIEDWPDVLVVSGELYGRNAAVRELFRAAARRAGTDVAMWGGVWPRDIGRRVVRVEHRLSSAAAAFKAHAMAAVGMPTDCGTTERFRSDRNHPIAEPSFAPV